MVRTGFFGGILYYNKEPPKNSIGIHVGSYVNGFKLVTSGLCLTVNRAFG